MKIFKKPIFTGFAPNITKTDFFMSVGFLFLPWKWNFSKKNNCVEAVEMWLKKYFKTDFSFTFDSGRTALLYAIKSLGIKEGDEVLVQAYTCVVVVNAIKWAGGVPIFVDITDDFNMDAKDLEKKITKKAKVLVIQHTFGKSADLGALLEIANKNNLKVVEDCAHSLGSRYGGKLTGTFGDIGMFSFGSDKVVSCVRGGALITNNKNIAKKIKTHYDRLPKTDSIKIFQHLLNIPIFYLSKPFYNIKIGKWILGLTRLFNIVNRIIYKPEKKGKQVLFYPTKLPNVLACLVFRQLKNIDILNKHRIKIVDYYFKNIKNNKIRLPEKDKNCIYLRYTLLSNEVETLFESASKEGIILGKWYDSVIAPKDIDMGSTGYKKGMCPNAEKLTKLSINLPTNINIKEKDAKRIVKVVNSLN